jgi:hypothetical protein
MRPPKTMLPSQETIWNRARARFHLSETELAMARATDFNPRVMDEAATGRRTERRPHDKLPLHATPGQIKRIKRLIRERYAERAEGRSSAGS